MIVIGIDAGHGGEDSGASYGGINEKDLTLALSRRLVQAINGAGWDVIAHLVREDDVTTPYSTRRAVLDKHSTDFVISIHANAADPKAKGLIVFYRDDPKAWTVAKTIARCAPESLHRIAHGIIEATNKADDPSDDWKKRAWNVLAAYNRPGVLVEMGFLTNNDDREALTQTHVQSGIVAACMAGVARLLSYY